MEWLYKWPLWPLTMFMLLSMFAANEGGFLAGRRKTSDTSEDARSVANMLKASIFGLVAFLLAMTFSMTSARFDARRQLVLNEANAVGTCYLRAELLGGPIQLRIQRALQGFVEERLIYFDQLLDEPERARADVEMGRHVDELWKAVIEATRADPDLTRTALLIPAANEVIDLYTTRSWESRSRLQPSVLILLMVCVTVSSLLIGHSSGQIGNRQIWLWAAFNLLFALVLHVVLDFDRSKRGLIRVDHQPLIELRETMEREAGTLPRIESPADPSQ